MPLAYMRGAPAAPALEAPAAPEPVGEAGTMPGTAGFTMACFHADKVPLGTKLYTQPLAAAPQAPAAPRVVFADWEMEDRDPVEMLDKIYAVYQRSMGKPAPDAEMAEVVELTKDMLLAWWGEHREDIRAAMVAAQDEAAPAAPAVDAPKDLDPSLSREVYRACEDLPEGWAIRIDLENGYGGVKLIDPDGEENELPVDGLLSDAMRESIAAAIAAQDKEGCAESATTVFHLHGDESEESDLSEWQPGTSKPAIEGRYLREFDEGEAISWFTDGKWTRDGFFDSDIQDAPWRGLAAQAAAKGA